MITALIPARGGSKGIPLKNIKNIAGKPLLHYAIDAANDSRMIDNVYVSTDSDIIKRSVAEWGFSDTVKSIDRSPESATDEASTADVMLDFAERVDFSALVVIQCTSPLLTCHHLDDGVIKFISRQYDSLVSVTRQHRFVWKEEDGYAYPVNHRLLERPRRQDWDGMMVENGAFIITSRDALLRSKSRLSGVVGLYEMPEETYIEIDSKTDFLMVERLLEERCQER